MRLFTCACVALIVFAIWAAILGQELDTAHRATRSWWLNHDVYVVDTAGVCLYVYSSGGNSAITSVPKTQLPRGTGCQ